jgi:hypothetical protein
MVIGKKKQKLEIKRGKHAKECQLKLSSSYRRRVSFERAFRAQMLNVRCVAGQFWDGVNFGSF